MGAQHLECSEREESHPGAEVSRRTGSVNGDWALMPSRDIH
jgi:hypothetical protein